MSRGNGSFPSGIKARFSVGFGQRNGSFKEAAGNGWKAVWHTGKRPGNGNFKEAVRDCREISPLTKEKQAGQKGMDRNMVL